MPTDSKNKNANANAPIDFSKFKVDFSNVKAGFEPHPEGMYPAVVEAYEFRMSSTGNPMVNVTFGLKGEAKGKAWNNYSLQPQALWRLKQDATRAGIPANQLEGEMDINELMNNLKNREVMLHLGIEKRRDGEGETNVIMEVLAPGSSTAGASSNSRSRGW